MLSGAVLCRYTALLLCFLPGGRLDDPQAGVHTHFPQHFPHHELRRVRKVQGSLKTKCGEGGGGKGVWGEEGVTPFFFLIRLVLVCRTVALEPQ